jgi:thiaminase/transcriptional activator TenA
LDSIAEGKSAEERKKIAEIFLTSCRYEYEFWDAVYKMKRWADEKQLKL